jgi:hypothetical protein
LTECGMPRKDAANQILHPHFEGFARHFYLDYLDAKLGNPEARARVDGCREVWGRMTRQREEQE